MKPTNISSQTNKSVTESLHQLVKINEQLIKSTNPTLYAIPYPDACYKKKKRMNYMNIKVHSVCMYVCMFGSEI